MAKIGGSERRSDSGVGGGDNGEAKMTKNENKGGVEK
jgi:hypothetical protein